jgi:hypothetical protein
MIPFILKNWHLALTMALGVYELVVRLIPTVANYSLLGKIIACLKWISDNLNVTKK